MKNSDYTFDFDMVSQKSNDGKLKLYLGIDKVRKQNNCLDSDSVNKQVPNKLGFKSFKKNQSFLERVSEVQKDEKNIKNELKDLKKEPEAS